MIARPLTLGLALLCGAACGTDDGEGDGERQLAVCTPDEAPAPDDVDDDGAPQDADLVGFTPHDQQDVGYGDGDIFVGPDDDPCAIADHLGDRPQDELPRGEPDPQRR